MSVGLNPRFRFDSLVVGATNRLAVTAARAVAEQPGVIYNPLLIYAPPGLGKTHLLTAIGHLALAKRPGSVVEYLTMDDFNEDYHAAVAAGRGDAWRQRFLATEVLLLDDVQFLAGRREMQAELLRLIDALQRENRQIVLASDRPPAEIEQLDERLMRRFGGGLIADIVSPDFETRVAILRRTAEERQTAFLAGVLEAVARTPIESVRELLGVLNRLVAEQAVTERPLTPERVRALLGIDAAAAATAAVEVVAEVTETVGAAAEESSTARDEFGTFLAELQATLEAQVENWRLGAERAVADFGARGFATRRLEQLLGDTPSAEPDVVIRQYEADVERLEAIAEEIAALAPELVESQTLRDPDALEAAELLLDDAKYRTLPLPGPVDAFSLETLTETPGNRMAVHGARTAASEPGLRYNPLVLVGPPGSGKTHLMHGIGVALQAAGMSRVACLGAGEFSDMLIAAIERNAVPSFRARFRRVNALCLDDVQLIAGRERTQEELFLLFNALSERGTQMVFTSSRRPAELVGLAPRLVSRLEGGLVATLEAPPRRERRMSGAVQGPAFRNAERVIWEWPDVLDRVIEEWR
jgi:chromosomal replication initiation ATPase DnaA